MKTQPKTLSDILLEHQGRALNTAEVCAMFGFSRMGLHKMTRKGAIPHFRCGSRIKFDAILLLRWYEEQMVG